MHIQEERSICNLSSRENLKNSLIQSFTFFLAIFSKFLSIYCESKVTLVVRFEQVWNYYTYDSYETTNSVIVINKTTGLILKNICNLNRKTYNCLFHLVELVVQTHYFLPRYFLHLMKNRIYYLKRYISLDIWYFSVIEISCITLSPYLNMLTNWLTSKKHKLFKFEIMNFNDFFMSDFWKPRKIWGTIRAHLPNWV